MAQRRQGEGGLGAWEGGGGRSPACKAAAGLGELAQPKAARRRSGLKVGCKMCGLIRTPKHPPPPTEFLSLF